MRLPSLAVASTFALVVAAPVAAQQQAPRDPPQAQAAEAAVRPGQGVTFPTVVREVEPKYTSAALAARIAGTVELQAVVATNGTVIDVRVVKSLDKTYGLDDEAVRAARGWLFTPGRRGDGQPVATIVTLILAFGADGPASSVRQDEELIWRNATRDDAPGLVKPVLVKSVEASYTSDAMRAKIQGVVEVEIVVLPNGTVGARRIAKSLDTAFGLDEAALRAVWGWSYRPGELNGNPVAVRTIVSVPFRIR